MRHQLQFSRKVQRPVWELNNQTEVAMAIDNCAESLGSWHAPMPWWHEPPPWHPTQSHPPLIFICATKTLSMAAAFISLACVSPI
jgi:hypothetical protein